MGLFSGLYIGRESLVSHGTAMASVADNLANVNTTGFKGTRAEFEALLAQNMGNIYGPDLAAGNGVAIASLTTMQDQGALEPTTRDLDFAVDGSGFFIVNDGKSTYYTRAGNFALDPNGNLVTQDGETVMGFTSASPTTPVALNANVATSAAAATANVTLTGNLSSASAAKEVPPADPATFTELAASSAFSTPVTLIDSLGNRHDVALHFFHGPAGSPLSWTVRAYVDGADVNGTAGQPVRVGQSTITFQNTGTQAAGAQPLTITAQWGGGAAAGSAAVNLSGFTGFASPSFLSSVSSDGVTPGSLTGLSLDSTTGALMAQMSNGESVQIGTIALARFINPQGLERIGDNKFALTAAAGAPSVGAPQSQGRGAVKGATLENSNVDSASQFIDMIRYQRGYQAGSQVIKTFNDLLNVTIQLA